MMRKALGIHRVERIVTAAGAATTATLRSGVASFRP